MFHNIFLILLLSMTNIWRWWLGRKLRWMVCVISSKPLEALGHSVKLLFPQLWHCCFSHLSNKALKLLSDNVFEVKTSNIENYLICPSVKQKRQKFLLSSISFIVHFQLYSLIFGDDIKHLLWMELIIFSLLWIIMRDALGYIWSIINQKHNTYWNLLSNLLRHNLISLQVKNIQIDNCLEFDVAAYYSKNRIIHQICCIDTPQQNGVCLKMEFANSIKSYETHVLPIPLNI